MFFCFCFCTCIHLHPLCSASLLLVHTFYDWEYSICFTARFFVLLHNNPFVVVCLNLNKKINMHRFHTCSCFSQLRPIRQLHCVCPLSTTVRITLKKLIYLRYKLAQAASFRKFRCKTCRACVLDGRLLWFGEARAGWTVGHIPAHSSGIPVCFF